MNPAAVRAIAAAVSMRQEMRAIFMVVIAACMLPVLAVLILTQAGIDIVSGALVTNNPQTMQVDIHDPATGKIVDHVDATGVWPVPGTVTLEFGREHLPYQPYHTGIDIASPIGAVGDPVAAFMAGTVTYADTKSYGFGRHVIVDHGHRVSSIYAHLDSTAVDKGQEVAAGTVVGTMGSTGWSTGPHLHFQINVYGIPVNPRVFLGGNP